MSETQEPHRHDEQPSVAGAGRAALCLTEVATEHFRQVMKREKLGADYGVRVAVSNGGCSGMSYSMSFENQARAGDTIIEQGGLKLFIDRESTPYLDGVTIDYVVGLHREGFKFINPKATRTCGCGESFGV